MSTESSRPTGGFTPTGTISTRSDRRRVVFATVVGTTVEWYDVFLYASAAGLVFGQLFFAPAGPGIAQILWFLTVGLSFLFRPLGAFLAGHLGDKYGRRVVLRLTLTLMGVSTTLIGVLPTYDVIGVAAPLLLIFLRVLQGISAGGEWGAAVLMAVEHAPKAKRGLFGASPQLGTPLGLLLASGMLGLMALIAPGDAFLAWGWRVPFLLSFVLILVVEATGGTTAVTWYLAGMTVIGLLATLLLRDRSGIPLGPDHEAEQTASPIRGLARA